MDTLVHKLAAALRNTAECLEHQAHVDGDVRWPKNWKEDCCWAAWREAQNIVAEYDRAKVEPND